MFLCCQILIEQPLQHIMDGINVLSWEFMSDVGGPSRADSMPAIAVSQLLELTVTWSSRMIEMT